MECSCVPTYRVGHGLVAISIHSEDNRQQVCVECSCVPMYRVGHGLVAKCSLGGQQATGLCGVQLCTYV